MASINPVPVGRDWTLIYDSVASGDFTGLVTETNGEAAVLRVATSLPTEDNGVPIGDGRAVTLTGLVSEKLYAKAVSGNALLQLDDRLAPGAIPSGVFEGNRAMISQPYTEANVKEGVEYEHSVHEDVVAVGDSLCFAVSVGSKPMLIKIVNLGIDGTEATYQIFRTPTYTGGTVGAIYNRNDRNPVAGEVTIIDNPVVTDKGTPVSAPFVFLGSAGQGQSNPVTGATIGLDHLLAPNTEYLYCFENTGVEAERLAIFVGWYEGLTDLPRP